jgi:RNA polymerase sigma-B factor
MTASVARAGSTGGGGTPPGDGSDVAPYDDAELALRAQFHAYAADRSRALRNEIVESQLGLAVQIARRFQRPGMSDEDLRQVAFLGLVRAVDRFEVERGIPFAAFAGATIEGELKRHFRDHAWSVRVPRSAKELALDVRRATDELSAELGRSPNLTEIAAHLGIDRDDVLRGLAAGAASSASSLDALVEVNSRALAATATLQPEFAAHDDADAVQRLLEHLPERERTIVRLRFFEGLSQADIAQRVGMSQMHVSRLLRRSLERLRALAS